MEEVDGKVLWICILFGLFNGEPMNFFKSSRGLRQGDLLYPFIFLIVVEAFGAMLYKAFQGGLFEGLNVGQNGIYVSHLLFVDDTLVLCRGSVDQMRYLRCVSRCFEVVLGLR